MKRTGTVTLVLLGLTTLQVAWGLAAVEGRFMLLNVAVWLCFVVLLAAYYALLRVETLAGPVKRLHYWLYARITERNLVILGLGFLAAFSIWYAHRVWGKWLVDSDFGSLYYRYSLLNELFPRVVAFNPMFNGGYETFELLRTGSINLFLVTYPITAVFSLETAHKVQPWLVVVLLPVAIYLSGRLVGFSRAEALFSSAFALVMTPGGHSGLMRQLFHGVLPFVFSCELAIVLFAVTYRVFVLGKGARWGIPVIILLGSLGAFHPFFPLILGPVVLATVFLGTIRGREKVAYCALIGAGLLVINGGEIKEILLHGWGGQIGGDINLSAISFRQWFPRLEQNFLGIPVSLAIGAVVGVMSLLRSAGELERRRLGWLLLVAVGHSALLSSVLDFIASSLEPQHFVLPLALFLSLAHGPSLALVRSLWTEIERRGSPLAFSTNASLLLLSVFLGVPYSLYFTAFPPAPAGAYELADWLKRNANNDGRVFFYRPERDPPGRIHGLLEGDASFHHARTQLPTMGLATLIWPRGIHVLNDEIQECLRQSGEMNCKGLYNIRYAITMPGGRDSASTIIPPERAPVGFRLVKIIGRAHIYESGEPGSYFLVGRGQVKQALNRITVTAEPSEFVVLKFFWVPGLRTEPPLVLEPYPLPNGRAFIRIRTNNQQAFHVVYR